jgi:hypothetical protein
MRREDAQEGVSGARPNTALPARIQAGSRPTRSWVLPASPSEEVNQAARDRRRRKRGLTTDEREELRKLRRENKTLRQEREFLKRAAVFFAKEDGTR